MMRNENKTMMDVVQREKDYVLFSCGEPLRTPEGCEVAHRSPRLLEQLQREWPTCTASTHPTQALGPALFRTLCALRNLPDDTATTHWTALIESDPLINKPAFDAVSGKQNNPTFMAKLMEDQARFALFFNGLANAVKACNRFLLDFTEGHIDFAKKDGETLAPLFYQAYQQLAVEEKTAIHLLASTHACGILLPLLLILRKLSSAEYVSALFGLHPPQESEQSGLLNPFAERLAAPDLPTNRPDWDRPEPSFESLRAQVWSVLDFLLSADFVKDAHTDVLQIIRAGESFNTEFKTSLRWNVKAERKDAAMEHAVLKTVNAFLNSSGGTLLVGVRDDGSIEGLEIDQFPNEDRYALHFWNLIKSTMGQETSPLIHAVFEPVGDRKVYVVQCSPSAHPVFLQQKGQDDEFYIRVGPSSAKLSVKEALHYINARFQNPISA